VRSGYRGGFEAEVGGWGLKDEGSLCLLYWVLEVRKRRINMPLCFLIYLN